MKTNISIKTVLFLAVVLLMVVNVVALITMIIKSNKSTSPPVVEEIAEVDNPRSFHKWMRSELDLSENQLEQFHVLRREFMRTSRPILRDIGSMRREYIHEILKEEPDTIILYHLNDEMQSMQARLKVMTLHHFLEVKHVLNHEQQNKYFRMMGEFSHHKHHKPCSGKEMDAFSHKDRTGKAPCMMEE